MSNINHSYSVLLKCVDHLIYHLRLSTTEIDERNIACNWIISTLRPQFGADLFVVGAGISNILLPFHEPLALTQLMPHYQSIYWSLEAASTLSITTKKFLPDPTLNMEVKTKVSEVPSFNEVADITPIVALSAMVDENRLMAVFEHGTICLSTNDISSIYLSGLLESMNEYFGQNDLLKRSIVLIKCWCLCESRKYLWKIDSNILTNSNLIVMIFAMFCSIGDELHPIDHPFRALIYFLEEYSVLDWRNHAISVFGIEKLSEISAKRYTQSDRSYNFNQTIVQPASNFKRHLAQIVSKYKFRYEEYFVINPNSNGSTTHYTNPVCTSILPLDKNPILYILDPIMSGFLSPPCDPFEGDHQRDILTNILKAGLSDLVDVISYFTGVPLSHGNQIPPDEILNSLMPFTANLMNERMEKLDLTRKNKTKIKEVSTQAIPYHEGYIVQMIDLELVTKHAELVTTPKISAESTICIMLQILDQLGPLPIGEIGKHLQIKTKNLNYPKVIKKEFQGLKKFIESFPTIFKFGMNHFSFNPVVYVVGNAEHEMMYRVAEENIQVKDNSNVQIQAKDSVLQDI
eukprot:gene9133-12319_t